MGRDLVMLWLIGEYPPPNPSFMKNTVAPKFSKPIRMLDSFTKNFSGMALSFEFVFCLAVQDYDWNLQNKFWLLMAFQFLTSVCPLKSSLCFTHFQICFSTLSLSIYFYIIYYIFYIYNLHYLLYIYIYYSVVL